MDKTVKVFYLRDGHGRPLMTIASKPDGDTLRYAVAICNTAKDISTREAGRSIAVHRLENTKPSLHMTANARTVQGTDFLNVLADIRDRDTWRNPDVRIAAAMAYKAIEQRRATRQQQQHQGQ